MNDRLCYSLTSNCLVRSEMFDRKKHMSQLELMNRFRKMHLYDAIHSLSGQKLNKQSNKTKSNKLLQQQQQQYSGKDFILTKSRKRQTLFNGILNSQQRGQHQNKLIKLKHFNNTQKQRPQTQTFSKFIDNRQAANLSNMNNKLLSEQKSNMNFRNGGDLIVRAENIKKKQQRLSIRLSNGSGEKGGGNDNEDWQGSDNYNYNNNRQKIKKWQSSCMEEFMYSDAKKTSMPNIINQSPQQQQQVLRRTQLSQVDEEERDEQRKRQLQIMSCSGMVNCWRMSLQLHDHAVQNKKNSQPRREIRNKQHYHYNNSCNNNSTSINDDSKLRYSLTTSKSHPQLFTSSTLSKQDNINYNNNINNNINNSNNISTSNNKQILQLKKRNHHSLKKLPTLIQVVDKQQNDKENSILTSLGCVNNNDSVQLKKRNDIYRRDYIQKFLKNTQLKRKYIYSSGQKGKQSEIIQNGENPIGKYTNGYYQQTEQFNNTNDIELLHPDGEFSTHFEDQFNPW